MRLVIITHYLYARMGSGYFAWANMPVLPAVSDCIARGLLGLTF